MMCAIMQGKPGYRVRILGLLVALLVAVGLLFMAKPAHADTFTVTNTNDDGAGSLRQAMEVANAAAGADTIKFDIPGSGVKTIAPTSELPRVTGPVTIDGYSQPGASPNTRPTGALDASILVELSGIDAGATASGLTISAPNVVVRGLAVNHFSGAGIFIISGTGSRIEGNFISTDPTGTLGLGNGDSVDVVGGGGKHTIGGITPDKRNLISGTNGSAVELEDKGGGNKVQGNLIGVQRDGASPLTNLLNGVSVTSDNNVIGGTTPEAANTIAFNARAGVAIEEVDSSGNRILGNSIFANGDLGIDLAFGGREQDPGDGDLGPNNFQNFPDLTSAERLASDLTVIEGTLDSTPSTRKKRIFIIQFFSNPSTDADEGKTFLGQKKVTTSRQGKASFTFEASRSLALGDRITATATGRGGTSELSDPVIVEAAP